MTHMSRHWSHDDHVASRYPRVMTVSFPSAYCARSTFLSNLPTLVLGTSAMNA